MRPNKFRRQATGGFTLVELLIVITIIFILAGLLLPALTGARKRAHAMVCLSNLHDIGVALMLYEEEYNGFPSAKDAGVSNLVHWGFGGKKGANTDSFCSAAGSDRPTDARPINRMYLQQGTGTKEIKTFHCPSDIGDVWATSPYTCSPKSMWDDLGSSYVYVFQRGDYGDDLGGLFDHVTGRQYRRASIVAPAKKIAVTEHQFMINRLCTDQRNWRHFLKSSTTGAPSFPSSHVLFADGSARYLVRDKGPNTGSSCTAPSAWPACGAGPGVPDPCHDWY